nr:hypothetical protein [Paenibacillus xylanexedens]
MVSIQTFLIPPQQSLPKVYSCMGSEELRELFVAVEHFEILYVGQSDEISMKGNELNIAVIVQDNYQLLTP